MSRALIRRRYTNVPPGYMSNMAEWTKKFLTALSVEEPTFHPGVNGGIASDFDVTVRYDRGAQVTVAAIDRRTRIPAPPSTPIELSFTAQDDPRSAAVAVAIVARLNGI